MGKFFSNMTPFKFLMLLISTSFLIFIFISLLIYDSISYGLPSLEQLENPKQNFATQIISSDGELLDHFYIQRRVSLPIDSIPKDFINALIATEDRNFYNHWGVHFARIVKAMVKNVMAMRSKEGGSTITMQLARNLYFNQENSFRRKIKEAVTAIQIEKNFTKQEILELYSNTVAFGRGAYGIQVASQVYFNKSPMELTTAECAFLVGILKAPEHYNSIIDYEKSLVRRNLVLQLMYEQNFLNSSKYVSAAEEPISLSKSKFGKRGTSLIAPHFVEMIRQQLSKDGSLKDFDLYRDGLLIYSTLNSKIQQYAKEAVEEHLKEFQKTFSRSFSWTSNQNLLSELLQRAVKNSPEYNAAPQEKKSEIEKNLKRSRKFIDSVKNAATTVQVGLVVLDPSTGETLAMVGGSPKFMEENPDAKYSLNHVTQIKRQPGSSFKPFVYASCLEEGMLPTSMVECGPYTYTLPSGEVWSPKGTGQCDAGGQVTLAEGLSKSINTVAARLITQHTTPGKVIELAHKMGITSGLNAVPALSLGAGGEVTPFEMTSAFATFANEGMRIVPFSIKRIEDQYGNILQEKKKSLEVYDAIKPSITHLIIPMMQGVVDHGTAYEIRNYFKNCDAAGKTGTTNDFADAWFVGFTPQLVAGVWVGCDDRRITFTGGYAYAGKAAAPIWGRLMAKIYADESLPYKQRKFAFSVQDSTSDSTQPTVLGIKLLEKNKFLQGNSTEQFVFTNSTDIPNGKNQTKIKFDREILAVLNQRIEIEVKLNKFTT